jgi:hypothetical protein
MDTLEREGKLVKVPLNWEGLEDTIELLETTDKSFLQVFIYMEKLRKIEEIRDSKKRKKPAASGRTAKRAKISGTANESSEDDPDAAQSLPAATMPAVEPDTSTSKSSSPDVAQSTVSDSWMDRPVERDGVLLWRHLKDKLKGIQKCFDLLSKHPLEMICVEWEKEMGTVKELESLLNMNTLKAVNFYGQFYESTFASIVKAFPDEHPSLRELGCFVDNNCVNDLMTKIASYPCIEDISISAKDSSKSGLPLLGKSTSLENLEIFTKSMTIGSATCQSFFKAVIRNPESKLEIFELDMSSPRYQTPSYESIQEFLDFVRLNRTLKKLTIPASWTLIPYLCRAMEMNTSIKELKISFVNGKIGKHDKERGLAALRRMVDVNKTLKSFSSQNGQLDYHTKSYLNSELSGR